MIIDSIDLLSLPLLPFPISSHQQKIQQSSPTQNFYQHHHSVSSSGSYPFNDFDSRSQVSSARSSFDLIPAEETYSLGTGRSKSVKSWISDESPMNRSRPTNPSPFDYFSSTDSSNSSINNSIRSFQEPSIEFNLEEVPMGGSNWNFQTKTMASTSNPSHPHWVADGRDRNEENEQSRYIAQERYKGLDDWGLKKLSLEERGRNSGNNSRRVSWNDQFTESTSSRSNLTNYEVTSSHPTHPQIKFPLPLVPSQPLPSISTMLSEVGLVDDDDHMCSLEERNFSSINNGDPESLSLESSFLTIHPSCDSSLSTAVAQTFPFSPSPTLSPPPPPQLSPKPIMPAQHFTLAQPIALMLSGQEMDLATFAAKIATYFWFSDENSDESGKEGYLETATKQLVVKEGLEAWARRVLLTTQVSSSVVLTSLIFLHRLVSKLPSRRDREQFGSIEMIIVVVLMTANKLIDDHTYTTKTWAKVSSLSNVSLNLSEIAFLRAMNFDIHVTFESFEGWRMFWEGYEVGMSPVVSGGSGVSKSRRSNATGKEGRRPKSGNSGERERERRRRERRAMGGSVAALMGFGVGQKLQPEVDIDSISSYFPSQYEISGSSLFNSNTEPAYHSSLHPPPPNPTDVSDDSASFINPLPAPKPIHPPPEFLFSTDPTSYLLGEKRRAEDEGDRRRKRRFLGYGGVDEVRGNGMGNFGWSVSAESSPVFRFNVPSNGGAVAAREDSNRFDFTFSASEQMPYPATSSVNQFCNPPRQTQEIPMLNLPEPNGDKETGLGYYSLSAENKGFRGRVAYLPLPLPVQVPLQNNRHQIHYPPTIPPSPPQNHRIELPLPSMLRSGVYSMRGGCGLGTGPGFANAGPPAIKIPYSHHGQNSHAIPIPSQLPSARGFAHLPLIHYLSSQQQQSNTVPYLHPLSIPSHPQSNLSQQPQQGLVLPLPMPLNVSVGNLNGIENNFQQISQHRPQQNYFMTGELGFNRTL